MMNTDLESRSRESLIQEWTDQHCTLHRYALAWLLPFTILDRLHIRPLSFKGKLLTFLFMVLVVLGLPLILTAVLNQWAIATIASWAGIALTFSLTLMSYELYLAIGHNVCAIGTAAQNKDLLQRQISWDMTWFNPRIAGLSGSIAALAVLASLLQFNRQSSGSTIPAGSFIVVILLSYQIGEIASNNLLMCFEARNFAQMDHVLDRFNPIMTHSIQRAIRGYNQFGLTTAFIVSVFIAGSALLLPPSAYLYNPTWLALVAIAYLIITLSVLLPRYYVQVIVQKTKKRELDPIRRDLNKLFDRLSTLKQDEYDQMLRLQRVFDAISQAPDSCLPFATFGRLVSTLILPTLTFVLAVAGETYLSAFFQRLLH